MKKKSVENRIKHPYQKPEIRELKITEGPEVLGSGCKLTSGGTSSPGATPCYPGNYCSYFGS